MPRCGLKSLTLHLNLGAQPAPLLPNRALSLPLLGPRCVTHEKAQGPGPLLQSHSSSWSFVDSSVHSTGSTRRFWGGVEGGESTRSSSFSGSQASASTAQRCGWDFRGSQSVSGHSVIQLLVSMILLLPESPGLPFSSMSLPSGRTCLLQSPSSLFLKRLEPNPLPLSR